MLFQYKDIEWETLANNSLTGEISFSIYMAIPPQIDRTPEELFSLVEHIDTSLIRNQQQRQKDSVNSLLIDVRKVSEKQRTSDDFHWGKDHFFIWEMQYETMLTKNTFQKTYTVLTNGAFKLKDLEDPKKKEEVEALLALKGISLEDYLLDEGKKGDLVEQKVSLNNTINE